MIHRRCPRFYLHGSGDTVVFVIEIIEYVAGEVTQIEEEIVFFFDGDGLGDKPLVRLFVFVVLDIGNVLAFGVQRKPFCDAGFGDVPTVPECIGVVVVGVCIDAGPAFGQPFERIGVVDMVGKFFKAFGQGIFFVGSRHSLF